VGVVPNLTRADRGTCVTGERRSGPEPAGDRPASRGPARWVVLAFVVLVPAAVTGLLLLHPPGSGTRLLGSGGRYYWLHIVLLFGFPATALVLAVLLRGLRSPESWIARVAAFVYACTYGAYDALAGITIAAYTMRAEQEATVEAAEAVLRMRQPLSATGIVRQFAEVGRWSWVVATIAAAAALHRVGVRLWVLVPLVLSGYLLLERDHVPPYGWSAFWALTVAAAVIELVPRRVAGRRGGANTRRR
jgi:hypothetical protein